MKKTGKKQTRMRIRNRLGMFSITFVTMLLLGIFLMQTHSLQGRLDEYDTRTAELEEQIQEEQDRTQEIEDLKEYMQTDEYAEEVARNRLGLIKENEIVFEEVE